MPIYEYHCSDCGDEFEKMVRFSEADQNPPCPACQGQNTQKKISIFASAGSSPGGSGFSDNSNCSSSGSFT